ncbi:hypothetical protein A2954_05970 [Candidatus Roizmanbacteria bacterium RIFCSPLOWO2_01_FULL_37_12]|uniref:Four helix bundle protein n=1 Tax=Candidatus Roizmanbacteria bacterium RIFCSPLOWO2_01_FULL_37_12 TaxID=1802056 RepID=A0A1F7ICG0_9BACT|nr:MAG: hypothetical protein A3D76_01450 [Candidatus Roizmanbacteria bacterium RIFCSPHIGHO2_02_FULL_37_9b]OGK41053.1 MAG: hypothetical protein A2954_05970 [Candidatus Roizmanbacteria bacterium RIFCSPLOWO2_01_FULL_37_12]
MRSKNISLNLEDIQVYQKARLLSKTAWKIYDEFTWQIKKIIGDQFITATDSVGGNVAEGYGRFHYLDRIKFFYNARGSLLESNHWFELIVERKLIKNIKLKEEYEDIYRILKPQLNSFINSLYKIKNEAKTHIS